MITLKKAFETQNVYKNLFASANSFLSRDSNITIISDSSFKSKAIKDAEDEIDVVRIKENDIGFPVIDVVDFAQYIANEIGVLTSAINKAKAESNYDSLIATNNIKRSLLGTISYMANLKPYEKQSSARGYTFNAEGNQVGYYYDMVTKSEIDYDRNTVKSIERKLRRECTDTSDNLDELQLSTKVDYDPVFFSGDTLEEAIQIYLFNRQ